MRFMSVDFSAAGRADDGDKFAFFHCEADMVQRRHGCVSAAIDFRESFYAEDGHEDRLLLDFYGSIPLARESDSSVTLR